MLSTEARNWLAPGAWRCSGEAWGEAGRSWMVGNAVALLPRSPLCELLTARRSVITFHATHHAADHGLEASGTLAAARVEASQEAFLGSLCVDRYDVPRRAGALAHDVADVVAPIGASVDLESVLLEGDEVDARLLSLEMAPPVRYLHDAAAMVAYCASAAQAQADQLRLAAAIASSGQRAARAELLQLVCGQLAQSSALLASLWLTAWRQAGQPSLVGRPPQLPWCA